jgi:hypothetical protein
MLTSCIDVLPIPSEAGEKKLFVVCEMQVGGHINAKVTYTGTANGTLPKELEMPDTFNLSLAEGDKDFGIPFKYDSKEGRFFIEKNLMPLQQGIRYKFRGIGDNPNRTEPYAVIPEPVLIDTIVFDKISSYSENDKVVTTLQCIIKILPSVNKPSYLYLVPKTENDLYWSVSRFGKDQGALKRLHHREGFIVDYSRLSSDEIHLTLTLTDPLFPAQLKMDISHVTPAFYQYNTYLSNIAADPGQSAQIPAIAGFNINTEKAFGSFSAMNTSQSTFKIK